MTAPNMDTITASLERSMQNCSLGGSRGGRDDDGDGRREAFLVENRPSAESTLELNSHVSLPYQWEQCLDLKVSSLQTGEIYYINWTTGTKAKDDPRKTASFEGGYFTEEDSSDESEDSSFVSSPSSREDYRYEDQVLVVAGCKSCLMYFMLPKRVEACPKCNGLLLHFDRPENGYL
ncbi:protein CURLY FLAG LEAF 1-like isoform X2 [Aristolochia californica]|uniref:protein CURLY FLAG LEAF 1-like isoform X2 n=1 Tax=Aristolochia californica TaxID=171875 RepID=UPI0035DE013F